MKYIFHNMSWLLFLATLGYYCVVDNPARSGNWRVQGNSEIVVYL